MSIAQTPMTSTMEACHFGRWLEILGITRDESLGDCLDGIAHLGCSGVSVHRVDFMTCGEAYVLCEDDFLTLAGGSTGFRLAAGTGAFDIVGGCGRVWATRGVETSSDEGADQSRVCCSILSN